MAELGTPLDELLARARRFLADMSAVGILERYDRSVKQIFAALHLAPPETYTVKQRLGDLIAQNPSFRPIEDIEPTETDRRLVAKLTRFDNDLYRDAQRRLGEAG